MFKERHCNNTTVTSGGPMTLLLALHHPPPTPPCRPTTGQQQHPLLCQNTEQPPSDYVHSNRPGVPVNRRGDARLGGSGSAGPLRSGCSGVVGQAEQLDGPRLAVAVVLALLVVAGVRKQGALGVPGDREGRGVTLHLPQLLSWGWKSKTHATHVSGQPSQGEF